MTEFKRGDIVKHVSESSPKMEVVGVAFDYWICVRYIGKNKWTPNEPYEFHAGLTDRFDLAFPLSDAVLVKGK